MLICPFCGYMIREGGTCWRCEVNKKGQIALWEVVLLMALVIGVFVWMDFKKQTETNNIESGAKQTNVTDKKFALINDLNILNWHSNSKPSIPVQAVVKVPIVVDPIEPTLTDSLGVSKETLASIGHLSPIERLSLDGVVIFVVMVVGGLLDALGGYHWLFCRRYIMPPVLGIGTSLIVYTFYPVWYSWLTVILILPGCGTLTLPYSGDGNFGRGLWLFLNAIALGLFLFIVSCFCHTHLLAWWLYIVYIVIAGIWGGIYKNWQQFMGDWITGSLGLCSLIFYVFLSLAFKL